MLLRLRPRRLRTRIIAWSFIPTAIILLAVALVTFVAYQRVTEDLVIGRNRELARRAAGQMASDMAEYANVLAGIARNADIYRAEPATQRIALKGFSNRLVVFDAGAAILNSQGVVIASQPERPEILGQDWSGRGFFQQMLRTNGPAFSDIVASGPQGSEAIVVAVPIVGEHGEFQGALAGMFRLGATEVSAFYGDIVKLRIGESGSSYLVDSHGRVIYHSEAERVGQDLSGQPAVHDVLAGKVGYLRTRDLLGRGILASYSPVPGTPWGLVTEESWAAVMAPSRSYTRFLYLLLALGVLIPALVVTLAVRRITGPIARLIDGAQLVAGGRFGQKVTVHTGDELEELARQFNGMSAQLEESYANLERRVADRTRELAALNAISAVVSRSLNLDEIMHNALDKTLEVMGVRMGGAYRLDETGQRLTLEAQRGMPQALVEEATHVPLTGTTGQAIVEERPLVSEVAGYPQGRFKELLQGQGIRQVVSVPLVAKGKAFGVIRLASDQLRRLTPEETSLLSAIGQQIGVALENARLYEQAEQSAAAAERNRLARDLHDAVSQTLFSASLIAEVLPRIWERNPEEGRRRLDELRQLTRGALAEMRTLLLELRPAALIEAALGDLLRQLGEAVSGRSRVPVTVTVEGQGTLPPDAQEALYRIAQEALNNVAKHSGATAARATLRYRPAAAGGATGATVELAISDDGRGFDPAWVSPEHLGLGIMRERAEAVGAELRVESRPGGGTHITVVWHDGADGAAAGAPAGKLEDA